MTQTPCLGGCPIPRTAFMALGRGTNVLLVVDKLRFDTNRWPTPLRSRYTHGIHPFHPLPQSTQNPSSHTFRYFNKFVHRYNGRLQGVQVHYIDDCLGPSPVSTHLPPACVRAIARVSLSGFTDAILSFYTWRQHGNYLRPI